LPKENKNHLYLRYPIFLKKNPDEILKKAEKKKLFLDDGWRKTTIVPPDTLQEKMLYQNQSCPVAEKIAQKIINLPTHINITEKDANRICKFFRNLK
jgi:dTDP-4-amino-4,6-dideoxygalactose transaminase